MLSRLTGDCQNQASYQILSFSFTQTTLPSTDFHTKFIILSLEGLSLHWSRVSWPVTSLSITKSLIWINAYKCRRFEFPRLYVCQWNWIRGSCIQNGILGAHRCPCLSEAFSLLLTAITCLPLSPTQKSTAVIMQLLGDNLLLYTLVKTRHETDSGLHDNRWLTPVYPIDCVNPILFVSQYIEN